MREVSKSFSTWIAMQSTCMDRCTHAYLQPCQRKRSGCIKCLIYSFLAMLYSAHPTPRFALKRLPLIQHSPLKASSKLIRAKHNIRFPSAALKKALRHAYISLSLQYVCLCKKAGEWRWFDDPRLRCWLGATPQAVLNLITMCYVCD